MSKRINRKKILKNVKHLKSVLVLLGLGLYRKNSMWDYTRTVPLLSVSNSFLTGYSDYKIVDSLLIAYSETF